MGRPSKSKLEQFQLDYEYDITIRQARRKVKQRTEQEDK